MDWYVILKAEGSVAGEHRILECTTSIDEKALREHSPDLLVELVKRALYKMDEAQKKLEAERSIVHIKM